MKKSKHQCDLKSCFLCKLCLKEWIPAVADYKENLHFKKGELVFREGDKVEGIYFIYEGTVKVHKKWGKDKELIVRFAKEGDLFGHRGLGSETIYPISATAIEPLTVCFIKLDFFLTSLRVNDAFSFEVLMFYARELQESEKNMRNLAHMPVKGRIASALLTLKNKFGVNNEGYINIILSKQDLASYAGTAYETAFRSLNELVEEKAVQLNGKSIAITNVELLLGYTRDE